MVLYFSGTGNSHYTAQMISNITNDELLSINELMKTGSKDTVKSKKPLVFVCPIYAGRIPRVVEKFIRETRFEGSKKVYFVATYSTSVSNAERYIGKICREKGFSLAGFNSVLMPGGYIAMKPTATRTEAKKIVTEATPTICKIAEAIKSETSLDNVKRSGKMMSGVVNPIFYSCVISAKGFVSTGSCVGCGKCAERCPLNNITLADKKPVWGNDCTHCMACISGCPKEAIEYKNKTKGKPRYVNTMKPQF